MSLITSSNVDQETHVDSSGEGLSLSDHCESVVKLCALIARRDISCIKRFVAHEGCSRIMSSHAIGSSSPIDLVEHSMNDTRVFSGGELTT